MRDESRWSIRVGRVCGTGVRVHMFFLLFAACTLLLAWQTQQSPGHHGDLFGLAAASLVLLAGNVLIHELAHAAAARHLGGEMPEIVIGPLVGLSWLRPPREPREELLVHLAGPAVNLALAAIAAFVLLGTGQFSWGLLSPLAPEGAIEGTLAEAAPKTVFWINWVLLLVNLLPAFPFDGGRALQAALRWRFPHLSRRQAARWVMQLARLVASVLIIVAVFSWREEAEAGVRWFALALLAIFLFFKPETEADADPQPIVPATASRNSQTQRVIQSARDLPPAQPAKPCIVSASVEMTSAEADPSASDSSDSTYWVDDSRVDQILARVHELGVHGLTAEERAVLEQASVCYRERRMQRS